LRCLSTDGRGCRRERVRPEGEAGTFDLTVKRREFVRGLIEHGCHLKRHGANTISI
jgi:hypothetical protein